MAWISAETALSRLGTKPQTLYANVSRGRIAARPDPKDPRRSQYNAEDVERLAARQHGRRKAQTVAADTMRWGDPVLESGVSTIVRGRLFYRGQDAGALAQSQTLEDIAALLWGGEQVDFAPGPTGDGGLAGGLRALAERVATSLPTPGRRPEILRREAAGVVGALASGLFASRADGPVHLRIAQAWQRPEAAEAIRMALVLLAEHELNASTFAARVAASTGASLAASVLAGLATLTGPLHGTAAASIAGLAGLAESIGPDAAVRQFLAEGRGLMCFGHRLYPDGDMRAVVLFEAFAPTPLYRGLADAGLALVGEAPNIDFALASLCARFALPADAPFLLFAMARSVGWLAHALEQVETGALIRPRAQYTGPVV